MAAKATMREVDTLSGMARKVFQCLTVDRYRRSSMRPPAR